MKVRMNPITWDAALQAAAWITRLQSPDHRTRRDLAQWLCQSPRNARELVLALRLNKQLRAIDPERRIDVEQLLSAAGTNVVPLTTPVVARSRLRLPSPALKQVGTGMVCGFSAALLTLWLISNPVSIQSGEYQPREHELVELTDGSSIDLVAQSHLRVVLDKARRKAVLADGRATFKVAYDARRPFLVHVGSLILQTTGAKFDVARGDTQTRVVVTEGHLGIGPDRNDAESYYYFLAAGDKLDVYDPGDGITTARRIRTTQLDAAPLKVVSATR